MSRVEVKKNYTYGVYDHRDERCLMYGGASEAARFVGKTPSQVLCMFSKRKNGKKDFKEYYVEYNDWSGVYVVYSKGVVIGRGDLIEASRQSGLHKSTIYSRYNNQKNEAYLYLERFIEEDYEDDDF